MKSILIINLFLVCVLRHHGVEGAGLVIQMPNSAQEDTGQQIQVGEDMTIMIKVKSPTQDGPVMQYPQHAQWEDYRGSQPAEDYQVEERVKYEDPVQDDVQDYYQEDEEIIPTLPPVVKVKPKKSAHVYMFHAPETYKYINAKKKTTYAQSQAQTQAHAQQQHYIETGQPLNLQQWKHQQKQKKYNQQLYGELYMAQPRNKQQWRQKTEQQNYQAPGDYYCTLCDRIPTAHAATYNIQETAPSDQYEHDQDEEYEQYVHPQTYEDKLPSITRDTSKDSQTLLGMTSEVVKDVRQIPTKMIKDVGNVYRKNIVKFRDSIVQRPRLRPKYRPVPSSYPEGRISSALSFENSGA